MKGFLAFIAVCSTAFVYGFGDCMVRKQASTSSHSLGMTAVVTASGKVMIYENGHGKRSFKIRMPGHHYEPLLSSDGREVAIYDIYGGLSIYSTSGKIIRIADGNEFLSEKQKSERTDRWACHPEGVWLRSAAVKGEFLHLELYDGNEVRLRMSDGSTMPPY